MCLAPEVDLVAGAAITVFAVDAIRHNRAGRTAPLALLPAVFAVHTFTSAFVWWGLRGVVPQVVGDAATTFFMFIAFVFLPIYVPISVFLLEPKGWRRDALLLLAGAGTVSGIDYLLGQQSSKLSRLGVWHGVDIRENWHAGVAKLDRLERGGESS